MVMDIAVEINWSIQFDEFKFVSPIFKAHGSFKIIKIANL